MTRRSLYLLLALFVLAGCSADPPRSGGRTAGYWAEVLQQPDVELRRKAATKLGPLVLIDNAALPALLGALKDADAAVRKNAARSLGIYSGPKGPEVLPALRELQQNDRDADVRKVAGEAIVKLQT
jgi:HEAT repeat protein